MLKNLSKRSKVLFLACLATIGIGMAMSESAPVPVPAPQPVKLTNPTQADAERFLAAKCVEMARAGLHDPASAEIPSPHSQIDYPAKFYIGERKKGIITVQFDMRAKNGYNAMRVFTVDCQWRREQDGFTLAKFEHWQTN
jgi:hypothetical protein